MDIDTTNRFLVSARGDEVLVLNPPRTGISRDDALNLAAWLVALAGGGEKFAAVLRAVEAT